MTPLARALAALRRPRPSRAPRRVVTRFALDDSMRVWQRLNDIDACIATHRAAGDVAVRIVLEFEQGEKHER